MGSGERGRSPPESEFAELGALAAGQARFGKALEDDVFEAVICKELAFLGLVALLVAGVGLEVQPPMARGVCLNIAPQAVPLAYDQYLRFADTALGARDRDSVEPGMVYCLGAVVRRAGMESTGRL